MIPSTEKKNELYRLAFQQIQSAVAAETDPIAIMSSVVCVLKTNMPYFFWVGFYRVDSSKDNELVVGPYQGTFGCLRIPFGKGVCGLCAEKELPVIVPSVDDFEGHIACDSRSKSEIVLPVFDRRGKLFAVLDVDSTELDAFADEDCEGLEAILEAIKSKFDPGCFPKGLPQFLRKAGNP